MYARIHCPFHALLQSPRFLCRCLWMKYGEKRWLDCLAHAVFSCNKDVHCKWLPVKGVGLRLSSEFGGATAGGLAWIRPWIFEIRLIFHWRTFASTYALKNVWINRLHLLITSCIASWLPKTTCCLSFPSWGEPEQNLAKIDGIPF